MLGGAIAARNSTTIVGNYSDDHGKTTVNKTISKPSFEYNKQFLPTERRISKLPKKSSSILRLNAICPYYTMFPLDFPYKQLMKASRGDWVLDPFCGRGTTNFAARLLGLASIGIDSNPVAVATASAKLVDVEADGVAALCRTILSTADDPKTVPSNRFWELCYHPETLRQICVLREELMRDCNSDERIALRALLSGVLHGPRMKNLPSYLSNQMPRSYATKPNSAIRFWESRSMVPVYIDVAELVARRANHVFGNVPPSTAGMIIKSDSRNVTKEMIPHGIKWVVTSPPYLGMVTYLPDQWLRNWFVGGTDEVCYYSREQITNDTTSSFIHELSKVWAQLALVCEPMAHMIIRFGGLPSYKGDPSEILRESIKKADSSWNVTTVRSAGIAGKYRQAEQFGKVGNSVEEIDLYAVLRK